VREMAEHPQVKARGIIKDNTLGSPVKVRGEEPITVKWVPLLGQHTGEILKEAGFTNEEIAELRQKGVI